MIFLKKYEVINGNILKNQFSKQLPKLNCVWILHNFVISFFMNIFLQGFIMSLNKIKLEKWNK